MSGMLIFHLYAAALIIGLSTFSIWLIRRNRRRVQAAAQRMQEALANLEESTRRFEAAIDAYRRRRNHEL